MNLFILSQYKLIQQLYRNKESLDIILTIDDLFDLLNLYAFPNWLDAEVVEFDTLKYYTSITLKTPYNRMPHPKGAVLLTKFDCKVTYKETTEAVLRDVKFKNDLYYDKKADKDRPKVDKRKCWVINILIPNKLLKNDDIYDIELAQRKMEEDKNIYDGMTNELPTEAPESDVNGFDETTEGEI